MLFVIWKKNRYISVDSNEGWRGGGGGKIGKFMDISIKKQPHLTLLRGHNIFDLGKLRAVNTLKMSFQDENILTTFTVQRSLPHGRATASRY